MKGIFFLYLHLLLCCLLRWLLFLIRKRRLLLLIFLLLIKYLFKRIFISDIMIIIIIYIRFSNFLFICKISWIGHWNVKKTKINKKRPSLVLTLTITYAFPLHKMSKWEHFHEDIVKQCAHRNQSFNWNNLKKIFYNVYYSRFGGIGVR